MQLVQTSLRRLFGCQRHTLLSNVLGHCASRQFHGLSDVAAPIPGTEYNTICLLILRAVKNVWAHIDWLWKQSRAGVNQPWF